MMPFAPIVVADEKQGPRGRYLKTVLTRTRILDAALAVFGEQGFEAGSLREVAERAEISQAGLLHHYPNKIALLSAVLERRDESAVASIAAQQSGIGRLQSAVDFARHSGEVPFEIDLFAVLSAEATRPEHPANAYMRRRYRWVSGVLEQAMEEALDAGHALPGVDPAVAASQIIALWDGLQIQWLLKVNDVDVAQRLEDFISLYLVRPLRTMVAEQQVGKATEATPA